MISIEGYRIAEVLFESRSSVVYRGVREKDRMPVVLKRLNGPFPSPGEIIRYRHEFEMLRRLEYLPDVINAYGLEKYRNSLLMVVEDFGGHSLKLLSKNLPFGVEEVIGIAIRVAEILGGIHAANIIHKDINPANIVMNPENGVVKLIDFGISTPLSREIPVITNPNVLEGTLPYISPEQTGRMNRAVDYRTDFYSFGAALYELLTRTLPFRTDDPMETVHCHMAVDPTPPRDINPEIPASLSDIILKLLSKTAEDRYLSAWGLKTDLEKCRDLLRQSRKTEVFPLGIQDVPDRLQMPQKMYGRKREIEILLDAFDRVSRGSAEILMVSGHPGVGKTSIVREIYKPLTRRRGYFISGKFDQFHEQPYSGLIQALQELIRQVLTESESRLAFWKVQILEALDINTGVLTDLIPELEWIVGPQPPAAELEGESAQQRFNMVIARFIGLFARKEHPLVMFLDDLQWIDSGTLPVFEILQNEKPKYCLFIGAFRDTEMEDTHPLMAAWNNIRREGPATHLIMLPPLELAHTLEITSDALCCPSEASAPLGELVHRKTNGNPFFIIEFLKSLYLEDLLVFEPRKGEWRWDLDRIHEKGITDNVVALMAKKIQQLGSTSLKVLQLAACIGSQFDLETLATVSEKSLRTTTEGLKKAVEDGLIIETRNFRRKTEAETDEISGPDYILQTALYYYRFSHDRIQQAAYSLIPETETAAIHRRIGWLLYKSIRPEDREKRIFEIVNQLNQGMEKIEENEERYEAAALNLTAGKKAKASGAFLLSLQYLRKGIEFLDDACWKDHYPFTLSLYNEAAESAYLCLDFNEMETLNGEIETHARTRHDMVRIFKTRILACQARQRHQEAIMAGCETFKIFGVHLSENVGKRALILNMLKLKFALAGKKIEDLASLPEMTDPDLMEASRIIPWMGYSAYTANPKLFVYILCLWIRVILKHGKNAHSPIFIANYALILCGVMHNIETGYRFGKLALKIQDQYNELQNRARVLLSLNSGVMHWKRHAAETLAPLEDAFQSGLAAGDFDFAALAAYVRLRHAFFIGRELTELDQDMTRTGKMIRQLKQESHLHIHRIYHQHVQNLIQPSEAPHRLKGGIYNEDEMKPILFHRNDQTAVFSLYFNKLALCYHFGEYREGLKNAEIGRKRLRSAMGLMTYVLFIFYETLTLLALITDRTLKGKWRHRRRILLNLLLLRKYAGHAPMNHRHKYLLVKAEKNRVSGNFEKAMRYYDLAAEAASSHEYIHEEGLAAELAGRFYLACGKPHFARHYLLKARYCYLRWGAGAKIRYLNDRYEKIIGRKSSIKDITTCQTAVSSHSSSGPSDLLDLSTVIKASAAISGEIIFDRLLGKLMKIMMENAGAERGALILIRDGEPVVEFRTAAGTGEMPPVPAVPVDGCPELSQAIVNYVVRTRKNVVLDHAARSGIFVNDPYVLKKKPKSVLCIPILHSGRITGALYLENSRTSGTFTRDRVETLRLLSTQAAISIDNARFYAKLEQRVAERTEELRQTNAALEQSMERLRRTQNQLIQSEKMASLGELVAGIAHEINTPLGVINANNDMLLRYLKKLDALPAPEPDAARILDKIREKSALSGKACEVILSIIQSLRIFARLDEAEYQSVTVESLIDNTLVILNNKLKKGIRVEKDFRFRAPVLCYPSQLNQVFINIINNAHDAMKGEGVISITVDREGENVRTVFKDTGPGIPDAVLPKMFNPGFTTKGVGVGTGLGLSICYRIIRENHGGDIRAENHREGGAAITVEIPMKGKSEQPT